MGVASVCAGGRSAVTGNALVMGRGNQHDGRMGCVSQLGSGRARPGGGPAARYCGGHRGPVRFPGGHQPMDILAELAGDRTLAALLAVPLTVCGLVLFLLPLAAYAL